MNSRFIHLHTHSHYSLLDGLSKIPDMIKTAKKNGMNALAITDHGNLYGAIELYKEAHKAGIKPIIGVEAYIAERGRADKEPGVDNKRYHLTLLARNLQGYKNLMRLVSIANMEGYYYKPRMDKEILRLYSEGIICLSGCMGSQLSQAILAGNDEKAENLIKEHQEIFGKEYYFLEVHSHPHVENDKKLRDGIVALGKKFGIPVVAGQDSHYLCEDDHDAHHTLLAVNTGVMDGKEGTGLEFSADDFSLIDEKTALKYFKDIPEAVSNTKIVADLCESYDIGLGKAYFPDFPIPDGLTADEVLRELAYKGFESRKLEKTPTYIDRLEYELKIIKQKGYPAYFLVVSDLLQFSRDNDIYTNIRGSVAGSLTTYLTGITKVDPIAYKLPFERFLNPERPSLPDIDMDFADNRRDEVIAYAKRKYGEDKVAQIGTFGTMMAKGSVRDVARALGYPYNIGDRISSMIPLGSQGMPMTIDHAMKIVPELKKAYKEEPDTKKIIDLAKKMEGCVRHISVHAAGVVMAPRPLYEFTPIQYDPKGGHIITQYDMYSIEDAGLPKFDFLGIRNLAILAEAVRLVKIIHKIDIKIDEIDINDKKTFEILSRGETMGLFQLNGSGMTRYLKELRPTTIHDINAMVALYRPGPMEMIPEYIKRKHNPKLITFIDPRLKDILSMSYGIITYQDDVLMTAIGLAGYSWLEADKLRKAMGKKIPEVMQAEKEKLLAGFIKNGLNEKKAQEIWTLIEPFAAYGFGKAHAASYGLVAYQTAYMKANYPVEYMTAIMTSESGDIEKVAEIIHECEKMNIKVLPPNINESYGGFTVIKGSNHATDRTIRFGFYNIKNLGVDIADSIIEERKKNGKFKSLADFFERINHKNLNKKSVEALAKCGAMDDLVVHRNMIMGNLEKLLAFNKESRGSGSQESLFGSIGGIEVKLSLDDQLEATLMEKLTWEKDLLGLYISGHPLDNYKDKIEKFGTLIKKVQEELKVNTPVTIASIIDDIRIVTTKKNDRMAFIKISDYTGSIDAVVFSKLYETNKDILIKDTIIALQGKVTERNGEKSIMIENFKKI
ncbi:TPA: DNA polymerase III subunit alpha [Candidatus Nomurabacteria bacterium]|nr:DNA polymerase III subunit alpha [Candidatus Nomurabacteria bacterium]HAS70128.1 DNA polymerase III subunit alpha [Candidatus Nomurabacteria bacterium]HBI35077.1 DNA polymerase III subunit alpha [Candidatus Nomurabacteria bacterium]HBU67030.1 DNA polymerase III subunit alpha [Candidatus Nomurabacteria bacterium]HCB21812.1 DNA polymerase III subunit alpha [Candidatus Nomurabacteria bacterium]